MKKVPIKCFLIWLLAAAILCAGCHKEIQTPEVIEALEGEQPEKACELTAKCVVRLDIRKDDTVYYGSALV